MLLDAFGQAHTRADAGARIVSLVPSVTELLFDLGLGPQVVGRTGFCVHPREALRSVRKVGGTKDVDIDAIAALEPTHVIVNIDENTRETFEALSARVPHVVVTHPNAPRDNLGLYRLLGGVFGAEREAAALAEAFEEALAAVLALKRGLPRRRVLYLIWRDPWMTVSRDTYIANMLELVNFECVQPAGQARYPTVDAHDIHGLGAELVLLSSEPYPFRAKHVEEAAQLAGGGAGARLIDGEMVSWYGSRAIRGLSYLASYAAAVAEPAS